MSTPFVYVVPRSSNDYQRAIIQIDFLRSQLHKEQKLNMKLNMKYDSICGKLRELEVYVSGCENHLETQRLYIESMRGKPNELLVHQG